MMTPQARRRASMQPVAEFSPRPVESRAPVVANACKDCRWAKAATAEGRFECRRWPPVVNQSRPGNSLFPIVAADAYCGEFSQ